MKKIKLKNIADIRDGTHESPKYLDEGSYILITSKNLKDDNISFDNLKYINEQDYQLYIKRSKCNIDDIIFPLIGTIGKNIVRIRDEHLKYNFAIKNIGLIKKINKKANKDFIFYWLKSDHFNSQIREKERSGVVGFLGLNTLRNMYLILPSVDEQIKIANFLDENCSKIDTEVSLLEKKSKLLEEYKQSLIFETVTKGLDKNAKMKDSGVEWIGEIPDQWHIKRIKDLYKLGMGSTILKEDISDSGRYPVYSATAEDKFFGYLNEIKIPLKQGDLVIPARGNSIGFIKKIMGNNLCTCTQTTIYAKYKYRHNNDYNYYYLLGNKGYLFNYDNTAIPQITVSQVSSKPLLLPPIEEQNKICNFLNSKITMLNKKIELIDEKIKLLKEYKQSLIHEAVTGQLEI